MNDLVDYYAKRAVEYEQVYDKPERQADLKQLAAYLKSNLANRRVLELACGTGYWTQTISPVVKSIVAGDLNEDVLSIARAKSLPPNINFGLLDAYHPQIQGNFDAGLACFWWSHVSLSDLHSFLLKFHSALLPGSQVTFADNRFVEGNSTPIFDTDKIGNTYQQRTLTDGSSHKVMKNFPSSEFLKTTLSRYSASICITEFEYFWSVTYTVDK